MSKIGKRIVTDDLVFDCLLNDDGDIILYSVYYRLPNIDDSDNTIVFVPVPIDQVRPKIRITEETLDIWYKVKKSKDSIKIFNTIVDDNEKLLAEVELSSDGLYQILKIGDYADIHISYIMGVCNNSYKWRIVDDSNGNSLRVLATTTKTPVFSN